MFRIYIGNIRNRGFRLKREARIYGPILCSERMASPDRFHGATGSGGVPVTVGIFLPTGAEAVHQAHADEPSEDTHFVGISTFDVLLNPLFANRFSLVPQEDENPVAQLAIVELLLAPGARQASGRGVERDDRWLEVGPDALNGRQHALLVETFEQ